MSRLDPFVFKLTTKVINPSGNEEDIYACAQPIAGEDNKYSVVFRTKDNEHIWKKVLI